MSTLIEQAAKGHRKEMEALYESNKQKVYYISFLLLGNEAEAAEATSFSFKNIGASMTAHGTSSEAEFTHLAIRKAVEYCKRKISRQDPKAFRIPQGRNFLISAYMERPWKPETVTTDILGLLPPLQRFILVLHHAGEYRPEQIASTFKFDVKTVGFALESEQTNVERVSDRSGENKQTYHGLLCAIRDGEKDANVPAIVDDNARSVIDGIATPIEKKKKRKIAGISAIVLAVLALTAVIVFLTIRIGSNTSVSSGDDSSADDITSANDTDSSVVTSPVIDLDETLTYYADIEIADYGTVTVKLDQAAAPVTVANLINLSQNGFYDGLTFHRIIEGFMMQGGDPKGNGTGGSGTNIVGEFTDNGYENSLSHTRGAISMARSSGDNNSASSQFFIVQEDRSSSLDGQYAAFGYVTEGMDIIDSICESAEPTDDDGIIEADAQPVIISITIRTEKVQTEN